MVAQKWSLAWLSVGILAVIVSALVFLAFVRIELHLRRQERQHDTVNQRLTDIERRLVGSNTRATGKHEGRAACFVMVDLGMCSNKHHLESKTEKVFK
jgi:hypothetical protein